jgi:ATP-binding cassette ChvD family protein
MIAMPEFVFTMHNVRKKLGEKLVLDNVTLSFFEGAKIGVVGPNGAGKSTMLKLMAGLITADNGDAMLAKDKTVGILMQEPPLTEGKTVLENIYEGVAETKGMLDRFEEISVAMGEPDADFDALLAEMGELQTELDHRNAWDLDSQLEQAMDALQCPPADAIVDVLSGGERRRVALCKLLLAQPDLLLLDEPTNHLDAESVNWLEGHLKSYPGAVLAVTHDRYFLDNVAEWICEIDRGRLHPYEGNYSTYLETKRSRLQIEGKKDAKRAKILEKELEWVRANPKARQAKNKARLARYEELAAEAERNRTVDLAEINIPPGPRLGADVLEADHLHKGFGDRVLIDNLSFTLPRAGIVGIIGPNGVGKTTLFRMIIGEEKPDSGVLKVGSTVSFSYVDQGRGGIDPNKNVWEVVSDGLDHIKVASFEMPSRAYVASFGFKGPDQQKLAGVLSGGERNRLNLALTLKMGGNVLLLDEPTNDLDVETLQSLEDALLEFPGCAVVISHDRWFLDRVATHILAWEGTDEDDASWFWFEGNFADYEENKVARLGVDLARPHRTAHRKLTR